MIKNLYRKYVNRTQNSGGKAVDMSFLPHLPLKTSMSWQQLEAKINQLDWFHQIDFANSITSGYEWGDHWSWVARHLQHKAELFSDKLVFEHGPADGLWSCWLTKLGCKRIVAADIANRDEYRLVIEAFGLPVEYYPSLLSTQTPRKIQRLFDGVVSLGVLYHVHDPFITLIMYQRYLKPDGFLILEGATVIDENPTLYYTGEGLIYGKEGGNQFISSHTFLLEALNKSLGFEIVGYEFRKEYHHPILKKDIGRIIIMAIKKGLPTIHYYPTVLEQLHMQGEQFGPIEWFYG